MHGGIVAFLASFDDMLTIISSGVVFLINISLLVCYTALMSEQPNLHESEKLHLSPEINTQKVENGWNKPFSIDGQPTVYAEMLGPNTLFYASKYEAADPDLYELKFRVKHKEKIVAHLAFKQETPGEFDLYHRLVESKELGISGTDMLLKCEAYLKKLEQLGLLDTSPKIVLNTAQIGVIKWVEKNNFVFQNKDQAVLFENILQNKTDSITVVSSDDNRGYTRKEVITDADGGDIRFFLEKQL